MRRERIVLACVGCVVLAMGGTASGDLMPLVESVAAAPGPGGLDEAEGMFFAEAHGYSTFGWLAGSEAHALVDTTPGAEGIHRSWSQITAHDPYLGGFMDGGSDAESFKPFVIESDTLPAGTPVAVTVSTSVYGTLEASEGYQNLYAWARGAFMLQVADASSEDLLVDEAGEATVTAFHDHYETSTTDAWDGLLSETATPGVYEIDYGDELVFLGEVGGRYTIEFEMTTSVRTSEGATTDTYDDTFAKSYFWETGEYLLSSPCDVSFVPFPEPAGLMLMAGGALLLALPRRR